ncbi:energy transducer TonB [Longimicrobium sp.]|jgi:TonB family protein|uniref:energy transducer TonB n=1 Tax=Longimicrobium sp. TaxID=2029185 RepID=UPI002EDB29B7
MSSFILRIALPIAVCAATIPLTAQAPAAVPDTVYDLEQVQVRPVALHNPELAPVLRTTYPPHLKEAGIGGIVVVSMVIGADGQPRDPRVVSTTDTAFDAPTLAMLPLLRFSPAQVDGRAVGVRVAMPITWEPGPKPVDEPVPDSTAGYELRELDEMPRIINRAVMSAALVREYPPHLRDAGTTGTVEVRFRVELDGSISQSAIVRSSHPHFNEAALRAIQVLRFAPGKIDRKPVRVWVVLPIQWQTRPEVSAPSGLYGGQLAPRCANDAPERC